MTLIAVTFGALCAIGGMIGATLWLGRKKNR